ncbi:hypothetical protein CNR22_18390 [Sphingobacteriaceae bacterium]|nr:hypothetical protein CNR22_18390 [Sphingobacteriaceae bacterium]
MPTNSVEMQQEYQRLFDTCKIKVDKYPLVDAAIDKIVANRAKYEAVSKRTGVPWYFIAIVHTMEGGGKFNTHLHNGDPLTAKTVQVPKNRPATGSPPFTWEDSAFDALILRKLDKISNWTVPELLYQFEGYNGFGYRVKGINSPYLWSFTNQYTKGKYTADGIYDPNAVSKQIGTAAFLRRMAEKQIVVTGDVDPISRIKSLGSNVVYNPKKYDEKAKELQQLLSNVGQPLKADGFAGTNTSDAFFRVTGSYLKGDKRP